MWELGTGFWNLKEPTERCPTLFDIELQEIVDGYQRPDVEMILVPCSYWIGFEIIHGFIFVDFYFYLPNSCVVFGVVALPHILRTRLVLGQCCSGISPGGQDKNIFEKPGKFCQRGGKRGYNGQDGRGAGKYFVVPCSKPILQHSLKRLEPNFFAVSHR